jgi:hypothetical protein
LQDGPPKYLSVTTYEGCSTELLRDFYMDNEYRLEWDSTVTKHEQLQCDENSGIEIGRTLKKFPILTPREYILAWRVWESNDSSFYCLVKVSRISLTLPAYCISIHSQFHTTVHYVCDIFSSDVKLSAVVLFVVFCTDAVIYSTLHTFICSYHNFKSVGCFLSRNETII